MKTQQLLKITVLLLFATFLASCTQDNIADEQNFEGKKEFKIKPYNKEAKTVAYAKNYLVNGNTTTVDIANDKIDLEIPIPLADFQLIKVYNISSSTNAAILYIIGRGDTEEVVDLPIDYIIQDEISISALNLDTNLLENGNGIRIFVMNNIKDLEVDSEIYNCILDNVDSAEINVSSCGEAQKAQASDGPLIVMGDIVEL